MTLEQLEEKFARFIWFTVCVIAGLVAVGFWAICLIGFWKMVN